MCVCKGVSEAVGEPVSEKRCLCEWLIQKHVVRPRNDLLVLENDIGKVELKV